MAFVINKHRVDPGAAEGGVWVKHPEVPIEALIARANNNKFTQRFVELREKYVPGFGEDTNTEDEKTLNKLQDAYIMAFAETIFRGLRSTSGEDLELDPGVPFEDTAENRVNLIRDDHLAWLGNWIIAESDSLLTFVSRGSDRASKKS